MKYGKCKKSNGKGGARLLFRGEEDRDLKEKEFISFLHYCAEHLNKGETVQAIWLDYQELRNQK